MDDVPTKKCTVCGVEFPATTEHFNIQARGLYGIKARCKKCECKIASEWRKNNRERARELMNRWRANNLERNRELMRNAMRREREKFPEKVRERQRRNYEKRRSEILIRGREKRKKTAERDKLRFRAFRQANPEKSRLYENRRRARKRELPNTLTHEQWQRCINYFNGCCAVCGRQARDLFGTHRLAMDHWIPLHDQRPDNPGTCALNIIPLCHGEGGCNNKKHTRSAIEWLNQEYNTREVKKILKRIEAYFEWVREQHK